ncbi:MAG: tetratricopeptide repeat protein, partial [Janthinobacterium lividum]
EFAIAHTNLGIALLLQGNVEGAIMAQQEAVRLAPEMAKVHFNLGNALSRTEQCEPAIKAFQNAINLAPDWPLARFRLANLLAAAQKYDEAVAEYKQVLRLSPNDPDAWFQLGLNLYRRALTEDSRYAAEAAKEALQKAVTLAPQNEAASKMLRDVLKTLKVRVRFRWPWSR